jgi:four helix bundle protein
MFGFQKLDVYRCARDFLVQSGALAAGIPSGHAEMRDQLRRAALSIPLNIAEGSGRSGSRDARRFYGMARASALECAALLDALTALGGASPQLTAAVTLLERIVAMLTRLMAPS